MKTEEAVGRVLGILTCVGLAAYVVAKMPATDCVPVVPAPASLARTHWPDVKTWEDNEHAMLRRVQLPGSYNNSYNSGVYYQPSVVQQSLWAAGFRDDTQPNGGQNWHLTKEEWNSARAELTSINTKLDTLVKALEEAQKPAAQQPEAQANNRPAWQRCLDACISCHSLEAIGKGKGGGFLMFDKELAFVADSPTKVKKIRGALTGTHPDGVRMPPKDSPQPTREEVADLVRMLDGGK